jgi:cyclomaltodextrinase / maltogenic alpha-amylase / neopullulanase
MLRLVSEHIPRLHCGVVYWNRFTDTPDSAVQSRLECRAGDGRFSYYEAQIFTSSVSSYLRYYFTLDHNGKTLYLSAHGISDSTPSNGFFEYLYTNEEDIFAPPAWSRNAVFYEIFPDRFSNGDATLNPPSVEPWGGVPTERNYFGGDLRGITEKLDHILDLGVDALYLTPIFEASSNHKYDTIDYFRIDPQFGTLEDLRELTTRCHGRGIRVILDGVFNHCGYHSEQFQDVLRNGRSSRYADWFYIREFPVSSDPLNYECVGYYRWMPKLRFSSQEVRAHFLEVGEYWIREADIDGWRLDVADEVDYTFWQEFRRRIKYAKHDALLLGETWGDGRNLLDGDQMDSVMNYVFRDAVLDFVARGVIDAVEFHHRIGSLLGMYKRTALLSLYNLLGSHDTPRLLTECGGDIRKLALAVVLQMMLPGAPAIYYGDELGMTGGNDPGCRQTMAWDHPNLEVYSLFRSLIELRKRSRPLNGERIRTLRCSRGEYAFARQDEDEVVYVVINNADRPATVTVPVLEAGGGTYQSLVAEKRYQSSEGEPALQDADLTSCVAYVDVHLGSYCFEIITMRRWKNETEGLL